MEVLYYVYKSARFAFVEWLLERLGFFRFVPYCLLVSPIFAGFLSVMLSAFSSWLLICGLFGLQMASLKWQAICLLVPRGGSGLLRPLAFVMLLSVLK